MSKKRSEVKNNQRSALYTTLYNDFRNAALDCGYALAPHGSMMSDLDLIAIAWVKEAEPVEVLVEKISDCLGPTMWKDHHFKLRGEKPHGRIVYTLSIFSDWYIDLSIIPPNT